MKWPSDEQVDAAAELVAKVARIPDLHEGKVVLPAASLDRVLRWEEPGRDEWAPTEEIGVELPFPYEDEQRLFSAARRKVLLALGERQDELASWVANHGADKSEEAEQYSALMYEGARV
jgi:hypothetical protein